MLPSTHPSNGGQTPAGVINGESGLEDVVNSAQNLTSTTPDGVLEPATYYTYSPRTSTRTDSSTTGARRTSGTASASIPIPTPLNSYRGFASQPGRPIPLTAPAKNCAPGTTAPSTGAFALTANRPSGHGQSRKRSAARIEAGGWRHERGPAELPARNAGRQRMRTERRSIPQVAAVSPSPPKTPSTSRATTTPPRRIPSGQPLMPRPHPDAPFRRGDHRRLGHRSVEPVERHEQSDITHQRRQSYFPLRPPITAPRSRRQEHPVPATWLGERRRRISEPTEDCTTSSAIWRTGVSP